MPFKGCVVVATVASESYGTTTRGFVNSLVWCPELRTLRGGKTDTAPQTLSGQDRVRFKVHPYGPECGNHVRPGRFVKLNVAPGDAPQIGNEVRHVVAVATPDATHESQGRFRSKLAVADLRSRQNKHPVIQSTEGAEHCHLERIQQPSKPLVIFDQGLEAPCCQKIILK